MPGYVKVNGAQQPIASPYVKVNGAWAPVALGYTKVNGEWKIWHSAVIEDNFNRTDSLALGDASNNFSQWDQLSGNWEVKTNQAYHGSGSGPAIAATQLYKATTNYKVSVDIPSNTGLGVAFWVQDADNWWAAIPGSRQQDNPGYYYCPSGFTLEGTNCRRTTVVAASYEADTVYNASYEADTTYAATYEANTTYPATLRTGSAIFGCPTGYSFTGYDDRCQKFLSNDIFYYNATCSSSTVYKCGSTVVSAGSTCTTTVSATASGGGTTSLGCQDASLCGRAGGYCSSSCASGCRCYKSNPVTYSCPSGYTRSGSTCTKTSSPTPSTTTVCTCPNGGSLSGTQCRVLDPVYDYTAQIVVGYESDYYECPNGGSESGGVCTIGGRGNYCPNGGTNVNGGDICTIVGRGYYCPSGGNLSGTTCTITGRGYYCPNGYVKNGNDCTLVENQSATYSPPSTTYPAVIRIYKSIAGAITQEHAQDIASDPRSFEVATVGNNINISLYPSAGLSGTRLNYVTHATTGAAKSTLVGIAKYGNQVQRQSTAIDNFRAE